MGVTVRLRKQDGSLGKFLKTNWTGKHVQQHNGLHSFSATGPLDVMRAFQEKGTGAVVSDIDGPFFSGSYYSTDKSQDGATVTWIADTKSLLRRVVYPAPSDPWSEQTSAYDVRSAPAETVILGLIDANLGPGALTARRLPRLTIPTSLGRGGTVATRLRFQNLGEEIFSIAEFAGLGVRIVETGLGTLTVEVTQPADLSAKARYGTHVQGGPGRISGDWTYRETAPEATTILSAAQGDLTARVCLEQPNAAAETLWGFRAESFMDARDTDQNAEIIQRMTDELAKADSPVEISATIPDMPKYRLGTDVPLGSKVMLTLDGEVVIERLRTITTTYEPEAVRRVGTVASIDNDISRTWRELLAMRTQLRRQQP